MIYVDKDGHRVETCANLVTIRRPSPTVPTVYFHAQGGGFQQSMPLTEFSERFTAETTPPAFRPGTVTAEWFATDNGKDHSYACYSNGDRWNGFGMPAFSKSVVDEMLTDWANSGFAENVRWEGGQLFVYDPSEDDTYEVTPVTIPGIADPLYPLGAGSWTWDQIEFEKES